MLDTRKYCELLKQLPQSFNEIKLQKALAQPSELCLEISNLGVNLKQSAKA